MILQIKVTIPENKKFNRTYEVKGDMTLFKFNNFILNDLGFAPDQMIIFEGYDEKGDMKSEYGMFDMGDGSIDTVSFDKIIARGENLLHYVFDLHSGRYFTLAIEGEIGFVAGRAYPVVTGENGPMPTQFEKMVEIEEDTIHARKRSRKEDIDDEDFEDEDIDEDEEDEDGIYDGEEGEEIYDSQE